MISRIRDRLGPAGFVVAVVALVAALAGGAYAASGGLSGKQKKEVEKIAKKSGKPGPAGPAGPAGPKGDTGAKGDAGAAGTNGTNGADGTSATTAAIPTSSATCNHNGGVEVKSASAAQNVCNGTTGFTDTLPSKKTEAGVWQMTGTGEGFQYTPITFSIPLAAADAAAIEPFVWVEGGGSNPVQCKGTPDEPKAEAGTICIYLAKGESEEATNIHTAPKVYSPELTEITLAGQGVGQSGALMLFESAELESPPSKHAAGSFAVTAP